MSDSSSTPETVSIFDAAERLGVSHHRLRQWVHFDETGRAANGSIFPNAYKKGFGSTCPINVPVADIENYKRETAGSVEKWDAPYTDVRGAAQMLGLNRNTVFYHIKQNRFPNAFKVTPGKTSELRIPLTDIEDFKKQLNGHS